MATDEPQWDDDLENAVESTLQAHASVVDRWRAGEPGTWGFLAGKAVLAYRDALGRGLTDMERRAVWAALWETLDQIRRQRLG